MIKLIDLLENKILVPRRSKEERSKNFLIATQKKIQQYMKDGSKGNLNLAGTPITSLPQGLTVGGKLDLRNTPITSLPQGLEVVDYLDISDTKITSLPQDLTIVGDLYLKNTSISKKYSKEQIKQMVPGVKGTIYI